MGELQLKTKNYIRIYSKCGRSRYFRSILWKLFFSKNISKMVEKTIFWILEVAIVNSYLLWNIDHKEKNLPADRHLNYRKKIITQLIGDVQNVSSAKRGRTSSFDKEERLRVKHFMI